MKFSENPFYVLGATPRDNRRTIQEKADEKVLELDSSVCAEARLNLTNPRKRLNAELAWFPGVSIRTINSITKKIANGEYDEEIVDKLSPLAGFNAILGFLGANANFTNKALENIIYKLALNYDAIKTDNVIKLINEDRSISGFPEVSDTAIVDETILELRDDAITNIHNVVKGLSYSKLNTLMLNLINKAVKTGDTTTLLDDIMDKVYAPIIQQDLEKSQENLRDSIKKISAAAAKKNTAKATLENMLDALIEDLEDFDNMMQPMQVSTQRRGLEHEASRVIAREAQDLAGELVSHSTDFDLSEKLIKKLKELFVEIGSVEQSTTNILGIIEKQRTKDKEWEKSVSYSCMVNNGWSGLQPFSIDSKQIKYGNRIYPIKDITSIRYGKSITYSTYGSSTDSVVAFGTEENGEIVLPYFGEVDYKQVTNSLWQVAGTKILMEMVNWVAQGKCLYGFIYDDKVTLYKSSDYAPTEEKTFNWLDVRVSVSGGMIKIISIKESDYKAELAIKDISNGIVLAILLDTVFGTGFNGKGYRLASLNTSISKYFKIDKKDAKPVNHTEFEQALNFESYKFIWNWTKILFWVSIIGFYIIALASK